MRKLFRKKEGQNATSLNKKGTEERGIFCFVFDAGISVSYGVLFCNLEIVLVTKDLLAMFFLSFLLLILTGLSCKRYLLFACQSPPVSIISYEHGVAVCW